MELTAPTASPQPVAPRFDHLSKELEIFHASLLDGSLNRNGPPWVLIKSAHDGTLVKQFATRSALLDYVVENKLESPMLIKYIPLTTVESKAYAQEIDCLTTKDRCVPIVEELLED